MSGPSPFEPPVSGTPGQPPGYGQPPAQPQYGYQSPASPPPYDNTGGPQQPGWQAPQGYTPPGQVTPPPKKKSKTPWVILGVVLAFLVLLIGGCAAVVFFVAGSESAREFVSELAIDFSDGVPAAEPATCQVDGLDFADDYRVLTTVTNVSGEESHYLIDYELLGPSGELLGTDFGIISNLAAGSTAEDDAAGIINGTPDWTEVDCQVFATTRVSADG